MEKVKPDALLMLGDTYSGLSVLPAAHRGIKIFHMEAGCGRGTAACRNSAIAS